MEAQGAESGSKRAGDVEKVSPTHHHIMSFEIARILGGIALSAGGIHII